ncbi:MAG: fimbria/pilus periplasmic chaperone [Gammaproteobacteria bacterium]|jgi:P pilus assembly chaperone PapD
MATANRRGLKHPRPQFLTRAPRALLFLILVPGLLGLAQNALAASQLMVTPTRVVFDGKSRSAQVTVINSGDTTGTYRISLVNKRMTLDGQFEEAKSPQVGELFADKMIRFAPRQVVLEPGKSQVVRLSLRKRANMKPGEYRSHMLFNAIPENAGADIKSIAKNDNISINLTAIVSIAIPVIVRHGETQASVSFASIQYKPADKPDAPPQLMMEMSRSGNRSVYGDLLSEFVADNGSSTVVARVNGVAVYTPNPSRRISLPLKPPPGVKLSKGVIKVYYRSPASQGSKVLAQTQVRIP